MGRIILHQCSLAKKEARKSYREQRKVYPIQITTTQKLRKPLRVWISYNKRDFAFRASWTWVRASLIRFYNKQAFISIILTLMLRISIIIPCQSLVLLANKPRYHRNTSYYKEAKFLKATRANIGIVKMKLSRQCSSNTLTLMFHIAMKI